MRYRFPVRSLVLLIVMAVALPTCNSASPTNPTESSPTNTEPAQSATVNVNANNTFSPSTVTIAAGGTVTFTNLGGLHNVVADDGSFRCANGCDGSGGDGNAAANAWSVTITFPTAGSVPYNCEVHVAVGMTGTVIVE